MYNNEKVSESVAGTESAYFPLWGLENNIGVNLGGMLLSNPHNDISKEHLNVRKEGRIKRKTFKTWCLVPPKKEAHAFWWGLSGTQRDVEEFLASIIQPCMPHFQNVKSQRFSSMSLTFQRIFEPQSQFTFS
jgi:hypothetical protein